VTPPTPGSSERFTFTADELRAAMRLVDPSSEYPDEWYETVANAPPETPWLLPIRVGVALTVVSERLRRIADAEWTTAETRRVYLAERALLERVARGEAPPPGFG
jgi:hypothetical protein